MKWSIPIGRVWGVEVRLHLTFVLLIGFIGFTGWLATRDLARTLDQVGFYLGLFLCVLLHEFGHIAAARRFGIATKDVTLLPIGGVARLERMPEKPVQELVVALAGPAVNVVIALGLLAWLMASGSWSGISLRTAYTGSLPERLLLSNLFLIAFNLLPAFPMDGGRVLRALLAMRMNMIRATNVAAVIGRGMALLFGLWGVLGSSVPFGNPMLIFIALFIWIGATSEAQATATRSLLSGVVVRDAMITDFRVASPFDTLGDMTQQLLAGSQHDFPVVNQGHLLGLLTREALFQALQTQDAETLVQAVMRTDLVPAAPAEPLETALARLGAAGSAGTIMPVLDGDRLVGMLTAENVGELVMIRAAVQRKAG